MGEVKPYRELYISVIGFVIALEIIIGLFYTVMILGIGGFFDSPEELGGSFKNFILFTSPYIMLYMIWRKVQLRLCKKIYIYIIVLLLGLAIVGLDLWVWDVVAKRHYSDGAGWLGFVLGISIQIALSLVVWIILTFLLKVKSEEATP